jgi:hypothetical protein
VGAGFESGMGVVGGAAAERGIWAVSGSSKVERRKAHVVEECRARVSSGPRRDGETVV